MGLFPQDFKTSEVDKTYICKRGTLGVDKSTVCYIPKKKESTSEFNNIKRPGRRKTTKVDDQNPFLGEENKRKELKMPY